MHTALQPNAAFKPPHGVTLRILGAADIPLFTRHLTGLDAKGQHDRFNGSIGVDGIAGYARRCIQPGVLVIAAETGGHVIGVAELHPSDAEVAEAAFSVSDHWRGRGVGAALFALILEAAWSRGLASLDVSTHADNDAMKRLARKFGAVMTFGHGESTGRIDLTALDFVAGDKVA